MQNAAIIAPAFTKVRTTTRAFARCDRGATAIEYALIASLVGVVILGALTALGTALQASFENTSNAIQ